MQNTVSKLVLLGLSICLLISGHAFAASISGAITCTPCSTTGGAIHVVAADGPDQCSASTVQSTTMNVSGEYVLNDLPAGTQLWLLAYWDADGNGTWNSGDYFGYYNDGNSFIILEEGGSGHDMDLSWLPEAGVAAKVTNVHEADGSFKTYLEAAIQEQSFPACFPDDVESIVVEGPGGVMPYVKDDFTYYPEWSGFFFSAPGSPPAGRYTISVTARGATAAGSAIHDSTLTIPIPDKDLFMIDDRTFYWDLVELADVPLYYRLEINHQGGRVYAGDYVRDMDSHTISDGLLTSGRNYTMRVSAADAGEGSAVRNLANSEWVPFTWGGEISTMHVRRHTNEAGESRGRLFFMIKGPDNQYLESEEGLSDVHLYHPSGEEAPLSSLEFLAAAVLMGEYGGDLTDWSPSDPFEDMSWFEADISDPLTPGTYRLVATWNDYTYEKTFRFNGRENPPVVSSASFSFAEDANGDVTWSWEPPADPCPDAATQIDGAQTTIHAIIDVYEDGLLFLELNQPLSTCSGVLSLPALLVDFLYGSGDEFRLSIQIRTDDENNRSCSNELILDEFGSDIPPETFAELQGQIVDEATGLGAPGSELYFYPGEFLATTDADGAFYSSDIPAGTYSVWISADGYQMKILGEETLSADEPNTLNAALTPRVVEETLVTGSIVDEWTWEGVGGARIDFTPGDYQIISDPDGNFYAYDIPPGDYHVRITADGYEDKEFSDIPIATGANYFPHTMLTSNAPEVEVEVQELDIIHDDGSPGLLAVEVAHPDGPEHIVSVTVDLSDFGGPPAEAMYDNGLIDDVLSGDDIYSHQISAESTTPLQAYFLKITATDDRGFTWVDYMQFSVADDFFGSIQPSRSESKTIDNPLDSQTLTITVTASPSGPSLETGRTDGSCYVELTIYTPNNQVYGVYQVYDTLDIPIPGADAGTWRFETENKCDNPVNYKIQTQGGGTGMITGRVVDAYSGLGVSGAAISCDTGGGAQSLQDGYFAGVAVAGVGTVTTIKSDYKVHAKAGVVVAAGKNTELTIRVIPRSAVGQPPPTTANVSAVHDPSEAPNPLTQPFAAKTSDGFLTLDALFPAYQQAMNLYLAMLVDYPGISGKAFLFDPGNAIKNLSGGLVPWRTGVKDEQSVRVLAPVPLNILPPAVYTFASMAAPTSGTPAGSDLIYYSITLGQAPPAGPVVSHVPSPLEAPDPVGQPLAAKITGGNLVLDVWFPPQQEASTLYVCYLTPGPAGAIRMIDSSDEWATLSDALTPWRKEVKAKQAKTVLTKPVSEMAPGDYTFYSIITTDPDQFSNYNMVYFTKTIGE